MFDSNPIYPKIKSLSASGSIQTHDIDLATFKAYLHVDETRKNLIG